METEDKKQYIPLKSKFRKAVEFAASYHEGQEYGDYPFIIHPYYVATTARAFCLSEDICTAAWLHDTLEDTNAKYSILKETFGAHIAELVYAVTDEVGRNRKERKEKTYLKIREFGNEAIALKLCDVISNVEASILDKDGLFQMYKKEYPVMRIALYNKNDGLDFIWKELSKLMETKNV